MDRVYNYNSIIFDINNSPDLDELKIPYALMNKRSRCEYQIFHSIIEYCLTYKKLEKQVNIIIDNIHNIYFKTDDQLINANSFKTYISYLLK